MPFSRKESGGEGERGPEEDFPDCETKVGTKEKSRK